MVFIFYSNYSIRFSYWNTSFDEKKRETSLILSNNDWLYYNDVVIPGALPVEIIDSIHLSSTSIGNEWQDKAVSLVLEYETICPESLEVLDEAFEYNYPPEWGIIVVEGYNMYK